MQKRTLIITAAILALSLAGCSESGKVTVTAAEPVTAGSTIPAETVVSTQVTLPSERLFGGYVAAEVQAELISEPSEKGEPIAQIPAATQLDIYSSGTDGWYMVEYDGKIGYIRAEFVSEVEDYDYSMNAVRMFRGYVESDKTEYLMSKPDENSDKLSELTYGTMLEIYSCDKEGWFYAELGGDTYGFVKTDVIKEMPHTLPFGERLFGGYIALDGAAKLYSDADTGSEVIREIRGGTQIDVFESETEGWYMTAIANDNGGYDIGYIEAAFIEKIPDHDPGSAYEPKIADIAGRWIYETQDTGYSEGYRGIPIGYVIVAEDGTYQYVKDTAIISCGTVAVMYEEYIDGSRAPLFTFIDNNGEAFIACAAAAPEERTEGCLYIGNGGMERLVPDNGNAIGDTDSYSLPNEYGFYEYKNPPASGVSVAALEGTWINADNASDKLEITKTDDLYVGNFKAGSVTGTVKLEFTLNPDNSQAFWYTFYTDDGKFWNGFGVSGEIPLENLYSGQDGAIHYVRSAE